MASITTISAQENGLDLWRRPGTHCPVARPCDWPRERDKVWSKRDIIMAERHDSESESRRILERVARETDPSGTSFVARTTKGVRDHVSAADADRDDPIEVWGTRIGRTIGLLLTLGLMVWLVLYVIRGS
jgi:hypothetical protein